LTIWPVKLTSLDGCSDGWSCQERSLDLFPLKPVWRRRAVDHALDEARQVLLVRREAVVAIAARADDTQITWKRLIKQDF
jgi:hypothetical protein